MDVVEVFWPSRRWANFEPKYTAAMKTAKKRTEEMISQVEAIVSGILVRNRYEKENEEARVT